MLMFQTTASFAFLRFNNHAVYHILRNLFISFFYAHVRTFKVVSMGKDIRNDDATRTESDTTKNKLIDGRYSIYRGES